ncbi:DUF6404 family protein [Escherichia coli]|uniref:DUF6404 family protein n=1 Tax=Escherichia coli TaxID=562 RepID=UPI000307A4D9|nr:DUF6404 family protein [Escherichia coli]
MTFEQKKARAIALMDSKKMWRSNYAPPLLRILWRLGIRLPPLPFMPFWLVTLLMGSLWGISWGCAMWFIYWGPSGMVAGEAIIISITGGFLFGLCMAVTNGAIVALPQPGWRFSCQWTHYPLTE